MKHKKNIEVRSRSGETHQIRRRVYCDTVGNFNCFSCRYKNQTFLVHSMKSDLGDPYRVTKEYFEFLFINDWQPCGWNI